MRALIPLSPDQPGGPTIAVAADCFRVLAERERVVIVEFHAPPQAVTWFEPFELMFCQRQHDPETVKVIRKATAEDRRLYRVPVWLQGDEAPECCGRPMHFVGQIDDDRLCSEPPRGAKVWWHDVASFYVFTCSQCLGCKTVGQQL